MFIEVKYQLLCKELKFIFTVWIIAENGKIFEKFKDRMEEVVWFSMLIGYEVFASNLSVIRADTFHISNKVYT